MTILEFLTRLGMVHPMILSVDECGIAASLILGQIDLDMFSRRDVWMNLSSKSIQLSCFFLEVAATRYPKDKKVSLPCLVDRGSSQLLGKVLHIFQSLHVGGVFRDQHDVHGVHQKVVTPALDTRPSRDHEVVLHLTDRVHALVQDHALSVGLA